jgi:hypothetical protein
MKEEREDPRPAHPLVDWSVTETRQSMTSRGPRSRIYVKVECPDCHVKRFSEASKVVQQIRWGMFTGRCATHRKPWTWVVDSVSVPNKDA